MAKRFLDYDARPVCAFFFCEAGFPQLLGNRREKSRRDGQIEKFIAQRVVLPIGFLYLLLKPLVRLNVVKIPFYVIDAFRKPIPEFLIDRRTRIFGNFVRQHFAKSFSGVVIRGKTHDGELFGKQPVARKIAQRGNQFTLGQITARAKNHHDAGRTHGVRIQMIDAH